MSKRILIVSDSFKESLSAQAVAQSIANGIGAADATARCTLMPFSDGGEGALEVLSQNTEGHKVSGHTTDALGRPINAEYFKFEQKKTAWIELSQASGLHRIESALRDPKITSTYGTGLLIKQALDRGAEEIILGIGGSATNDAGTGIIKALGGKFLDAQGKELPNGGLALSKLETIKCPERLKKIKWHIACDVTNPLLGPNGATYIYGPQKGAQPQDLDPLEQALQQFARVVKQSTGRPIDTVPGGGAAGGTAAGLFGLLNTQLVSGFDLLANMAHLEEAINQCDYVFTAEGRIDAQSIHGKVPIAVSAIAKKFNKPVIGIAGSIQGPFDQHHELGLTSLFSIQNGPMDLSESKLNSAELIQDTASRIWQLIKSNN
jgi:glycerate kinase